ncbi:hypothetical protein M948_17720 [Virgibacillus sp. CM-4]|uniref:glutamate-5-semialdehyde dehydrogenase n=1 Tax=Virgibacillus sp. CM-4 TaxID=1354277 RepID=UPI000388573E|nr:glutamate-5-semialdehyde dehydrogenase [Virgibacillus sp. CM-4]EQB34947.1 hypothetical protein M948_17720 [Virgibacillus sp. CM-4]
MEEVLEKGKLAKVASYQLNGVTTEDKNKALQLIADQLIQDLDYILSENQKDIVDGRTNGLNESLIDRIMLDKDRIRLMYNAIYQLIDLADPIGDVLESIEKDNGLLIERKRVPIGVIGMIYEARPNVTIDAATLAVKTGNAVILRGSSSAKYSNQALVHSIHQALSTSNLSVDAVQLIENTNRDSAKALFTLNEYLDVLIPRGGKNLIETVIKESTVPVIETGAGNCHVYIDDTADVKMVQDIAINAKIQRPSVCNAIETVLIHEDWFNHHGVELLDTLRENKVEIYGDDIVCEAFPFAKQALEEIWYTEFLDLAIAVRVVKNCNSAVNHINAYGTKHSEAIITANDNHAIYFQTHVDAAAVYHNASTRFTDGFEFGYGAEIGISTQKLHARGPMGLPALTSSKFFIHGTGQIRS